jgi:hypothetical protein
MEHHTTDQIATTDKDALLGRDHTRFVEYSFGNLQTHNIKVSGDVVISGIAMGNPSEGGTITIPGQISTLIIQNTAPYTSLTIVMPLLPEYGKLLTITSTVEVINANFIQGSFGTAKPTTIKASVPLRFIFAGSWFNI